MNFVYPEFLFALAAVSVPIIIHLFNFRRFKKVYFSDIRFLKDIDIETKSRNQLKNLLILLARILAVSCLVLGFAQPVIPTSDTQKTASETVVVYVDNSFSMNATGQSGSLFDEASAKALEVASVYSGSAQLQLLTNDFKPEHARYLSIEEFKNEVASIQPSGQHRTISEVLSRATAFNSNIANKSIYFISDFQRDNENIFTSLTDTTTRVYVIPIEPVIESNIYIDTCWFNEPVRLPEQADLLSVRIRNEGDEIVENLSVKLMINDIQRAVNVVTIAPHSFEDAQLSFTNARGGMQLAKVEIQDYPITFDNTYYLSYSLSSTVRILNITGDEPSEALKTLFTNDANFEISTVSSTALDYSKLSEADFVICNQISTYSSGMIQELMQFTMEGGDAVVIPAPDQDLVSLNELLLSVGADQLTELLEEPLKVEQLNTQSSIFKNVFIELADRIDLPKVQKYFSTKRNSKSGAERLMTLANGDALLSKYPRQGANVYVLTTNLSDDHTNFHRHALFVPSFYNMALNSVSNQVSQELIGDNHLIKISNTTSVGTEPLRLSSKQRNQGFIPERVSRGTEKGILVHDQIKEGGHYLLMAEEDTVQSISFNYNRSESVIDFFDPTDLKEFLQQAGLSTVEVITGNTENIATTIREIHEGIKLWKLFLLFALAFLLIETVLIRIL